LIFGFEGEKLANGKIFVAIAGNIGTGKTTLTRLLSEHFGWESHFEAVTENPYLADFYTDMKRWSFPVQIFFLNSRFTAHQTITQGNLSSIQDRSIYEDANIFARNLYEDGMMEEREYQTYLELYNVMHQYLTPPDLILYLKKSVPKLQDRIALRARDFEKNIPKSYLENLNRYYDEWMDSYDLGKKLIVESDDLDFLENPKDFDWLCDQIGEATNQSDLYFESEMPQRA
tara:strand:+ start:3341 stop:4030 length:690 start_codon:yes stop_codon:yes gene_type:complete